MRQSLSVIAIACALFCGGQVSATTPLGLETVPQRLNQTIPSGKLDQKLFGEAVLLYSNAARRAHSLPPLSPDKKLARAAVGHAENMARLRTHSHVLPIRGQSNFKQRIDRQSLKYRTAGENIAMNKVYRLLGRPISAKMQGCAFTYGDTREPVPMHTYATLGKEAVNRWLASPKHRASLLSPGFRRIGSGVGVDPAGPACGDLYLVQDFAD